MSSDLSAQSTAARTRHRGIVSPKLKSCVFVLEGLNSLATTYFFYYLYFFTKEKFHFGTLDNFVLAASLGLIYTVSAILGGRFAQKHGYFFSLRLGVGVMVVSLLIGSQFENFLPQLAILVMATIGMCFTWPSYQALVSEGEPPARLQGWIGLYNFTWAATSAFAYFTGGAIIEKLGFKSMFLVPVGLLLLQLAFSFWLEKQVAKNDSPRANADEKFSKPIPTEAHRSILPPKIFLKMAWLANPFAYIAINTVISIAPTLADKLKLTPSQAGFFCSVWLFVRAGAFILLRLWPKWHYRFHFLAGAYATMVVCFALMLLATNLFVLIVAEIFFGLSLGLIYYSSLFYSMNAGETKGKHGGIHEAAIGAGCCTGPAMGAVALYFFPNHPDSGAWAVSILLLAGLGGLFWLRFKNQKVC